MLNFGTLSMSAAVGLVLAFWSTVGSAADEIIHDAEYSILKAQNGEKWTKDDQTIDEKLAEIRNKNGGKPPNIVYIRV